MCVLKIITPQNKSYDYEWFITDITNKRTLTYNTRLVRQQNGRLDPILV